jgi:hypothetical protein
MRVLVVELGGGEGQSRSLSVSNPLLFTAPKDSTFT